ncbi:nucleotidyltransferase family protein [Pseudomonas otitidis]|uniref:nucleotidyltransferase family protein n=1 Tax=Metapseudomonas otitidis TaxID=319939 RepID=UPI0024ADB793|nr:nucleotidyltransferase family protein [Pseudomonas otitidis]MDI6527823.1 nucleotidyltransferase family protein [Pseudomonas otitidis]
MREAIILAGGFGTRLRELVPDLPKPMAPVAGQPFIEIVLRSLAAKGFSRVVLSLGYMAEKISNYFGSNFEGMDIHYAVEDQPLGTGGAVRLALTQCTREPIFILNGDTFLDFEVDCIERLWLEHRRPIIVAREVPDTGRYGRLLVQDGLVKGLTEKGAVGPGLINAGFYVFNRVQLDAFELNQPFSIEVDFLAKAVGEMPVDVFVTQGQFIDIGVPEDFHRAQTELAGR